MTVPVLVLLFNRPNETAQVMQAISNWETSCLYLAADGPRPNHPSDVDLCEEARKIALSAVGDRRFKTLFRDGNLGCGRAVSSALDWFFTHEESGIILEDDCVPDPSFLPFCGELLDRYRETTQVMMISGNNFLFEHEMKPDEYLFVRHAHIWGWATWRRAWDLYDFQMKEWSELRSTTWLHEICGGHRDAIGYWKWIFDRTVEQDFRTWDYQWNFTLWAHNGVSVTPGRNLLRNIGFGDSATFTMTTPNWLHRLGEGSVVFPLSHPDSISVDPTLQRWTDIHIFRTRNLWYRTMRFIGRTAGRIGWEEKLRKFYRWLSTVKRR